MTSLCKTDGYGIYLLNENGKELIGVQHNTDRLVYTIAEDTKKICKKAFENCTKLEGLEIPESVEEMDENVFSHGNRNLHIVSKSKDVVCENGYVINHKTQTLVFYCGNETILTIPSSVTCIGKNSFRSYTGESITIPTSVKEIHEDAFTTCCVEKIHLDLDEVDLYFPIQDIRLRQHMLEGFGRNGIFDYERYDQDLVAGFLEDERMKMIVARLHHPVQLPQAIEERYRTYLATHLEGCIECVGKANDLFTLELLCKTSIIDEENIHRCLAALHRLQNLEPFVYLSHYQDKHNLSNAFDYDL